MIIYYSYSY